MRRRALAALAVATWSKTTAAAFLPSAFSAHPAAASAGPGESSSPSATSTSCPNGPFFQPPNLYGQTVEAGASTTYKGSTLCGPGSYWLEASVDRQQWKALAGAHTDSSGSVLLDHACLPGTWWYRGEYRTDDGAYKGNTDTASPRQFAC